MDRHHPSLVLPLVWLIVCKLVPAPMVDPLGIAGSLLAAGLLFWQLTRAKAKLGANPVSGVPAQ